MNRSVAFIGFENEFNHHLLSGPWRIFEATLISRGYRIVSPDSNPEYFIFINHHPRKYKRYVRNSKKTAIILMEPPSTSPQNFRRNLPELFQNIYSPSPLWHGAGITSLFNWPIGKPANLKENYHKRMVRSISDHGNKFSLKEGNLYLLRRKLAEIVDLPIDTYGTQWNMRFHEKLLKVASAISGIASPKEIKPKEIIDFILFPRKNFTATPMTKTQIMSKYRFSIVIENDPSYVSEKLWDALNAETIPIYVGPRLLNFGIPENIVVQCDHSVESITSTFKSLLDTDCYSKYLMIREFKQSSRWSEQVNLTVIEKLAVSIANNFDNQKYSVL